MVDVQKVDVVGKPADAKHGDDDDEHLNHVLLVFPGLGQSIRVVTNNLVSPQLGAHLGVGDDHDDSGYQIRQQEEDAIIAVNGKEESN